ncbi:MAG: TIGR02757 family protein [Polyangiales bacterium]
MDAIGERLEALLGRCDPAERRQRDPVDFVHQYHEPADQEVAGLIAASLAFGNAQAARRSAQRVLDALGPRPAHVVAEAGEDELFDRIRGFTHRIYRDEHMSRLLARAGQLLDAHGSLGVAFRGYYEQSRGDFREAMACLADALRGETRTRAMKHLVSDPRAGSACKRLVLYARWMIRPSDGVDLGLWPIDPSVLLMPVDTHVHRISLNLGLTSRRTASWVTAEEITSALRRYDPTDPVKYDFALCHLGVSRECPSRPVHDKCARCVLQDVCRVWGDDPRGGSAKEAGQLRL